MAVGVTVIVRGEAKARKPTSPSSPGFRRGDRGPLGLGGTHPLHCRLRCRGTDAHHVLRRRHHPGRQQTGRDPRGAVDASGVQSGAGERLGELMKEGFCLG